MIDENWIWWMQKLMQTGRNFHETHTSRLKNLNMSKNIKMLKFLRNNMQDGIGGGGAGEGVTRNEGGQVGGHKEISRG